MIGWIHFIYFIRSGSIQIRTHTNERKNCHVALRADLSKTKKVPMQNVALHVWAVTGINTEREGVIPWHYTALHDTTLHWISQWGRERERERAHSLCKLMCGTNLRAYMSMSHTGTVVCFCSNSNIFLSELFVWDSWPWGNSTLNSEFDLGLLPTSYSEFYDFCQTFWRLTLVLLVHPKWRGKTVKYIPLYTLYQ